MCGTWSKLYVYTLSFLLVPSYYVSQFLFLSLFPHLLLFVKTFEQREWCLIPSVVSVKYVARGMRLFYSTPLLLMLETGVSIIFFKFASFGPDGEIGHIVKLIYFPSVRFLNIIFLCNGNLYHHTIFHKKKPQLRPQLMMLFQNSMK